MRTICQVHTSAEDRQKTTQWLPEKHHGWVNGERLFKINCSGCHDVEGKVKTGPALNTIWQTEERMVSGETVKVDENYIRESILVPNAKIVEGFGPVSKMNSFAGKLSDQEIHYLIEYIHYLQDPTAFPSRDEPVTTEENQAEDKAVEEDSDKADSDADAASETTDGATDDPSTETDETDETANHDKADSDESDPADDEENRQADPSPDAENESPGAPADDDGNRPPAD